MSLGTGPDIEQFDRKAEEKQKLMDKVNEWWEDLDESEKLDVIEGIYPDQAGLIDSDELWERTDWNDRLDIYREANGYND